MANVQKGLFIEAVNLILRNQAVLGGALTELADALEPLVATALGQDLRNTVEDLAWVFG